MNVDRIDFSANFPQNSSIWNENSNSWGGGGGRRRVRKYDLNFNFTDCFLIFNSILYGPLKVWGGGIHVNYYFFWYVNLKKKISSLNGGRPPGPLLLSACIARMLQSNGIFWFQTSLFKTTSIKYFNQKFPTSNLPYQQ